MVGAIAELNLVQPVFRLLHCGFARFAPGQQRHGDIFLGGELGEQVVKLPHVADFAIAKICGLPG